MVPSSNRNVHSSSTATIKEQKLKKPTRGGSCSNCKENIMTSGVDQLRERLFKKGVSETPAKFIASARRKCSESNYNSSWRILDSWCDKQQVHAFRCNVIKILDYLVFLFEKGYKYRTIGYYKSAISACALVSGIFNKRPPQPKYMFVWSVELVINYIKTKWKNNESLSVKIFDLKPCDLNGPDFCSQGFCRALSQCKVYGLIRGCLQLHFS